MYPWEYAAVASRCDVAFARWHERNRRGGPAASCCWPPNARNCSTPRWRGSVAASQRARLLVVVVVPRSGAGLTIAHRRGRPTLGVAVAIGDLKLGYRQTARPYTMSTPVPPLAGCKTLFEEREYAASAASTSVGGVQKDVQSTTVTPSIRSKWSTFAVSTESCSTIAVAPM